MDESWRMSMGSVIPRRRSTEQYRRSRWGGAGAGGTGALDADDFHDVFGGPPRTVLLRRFSGDLTAGEARPAGSFYDEIFRRAELGIPLARGGRRLPGFRIPAARGGGLVKMEEGFYDDIFGSDGGGGGERRSRSRSKSTSRSKSSSVLSSEEELSPPLRPSIAEDAMLSSFASKLRPITIPSRRRHDYYSSPPSTILSGGGDHQNSSHKAGLSIPCPPGQYSYSMEFKDNSNSINDHDASDVLGHRSHIGFCCFSPPETISLDQPASFRRGLKSKPGADDNIDSPSSVISSVFLEPVVVVSTKTGRETEKKVVVEVDGEGELAAENSFFIEIDSHGGAAGETEGAAAVDEAIAWAKEKFWSQTSKGGVNDTIDKQQLNSEIMTKGGGGVECKESRPVANEEDN